MRVEITSKIKSKDEKLDEYITKKINKLEKYMSSHARKSVHAEVKLKEYNDKKQKCQCEVVLHMPNETIIVEEATINMYAAFDVVEERLKNRLKKYHELHNNHTHKVRRAVRRIKHLVSRTSQE